MASLIEATPSERYQQLQSFIDVEGVERSEQSLRDALRIAEKAVDYNSTTRLEAEAMLERFWNDEGQPGAPVETPISWASKQSSVNLHEIDSSQNRIREILVKLDKLLSTAENYLQSESNAVDKQTELARVSNSIEQQPDTPQIQAVEAIELLDILRQARKYLTSSRGGQNLENNSCPVCEQSVDTPDLINRIDERLTVNSTFTKLGDSLQAAKKGVENANAVIERDRNDMISTARDLYPLIKDNGDIAGSIVSAFKFDNWNEDKTSELNKLIDLLRTYRASLLRERDGNLKIVNQLNSIQQFYKRVVDLSADLSESKMQADRLKQALDMVHYLRMDFTQQILSKVKTETNRLYFAIHPDEPLGLDDLRMDMDKRASLIQGCNFEGYDNVVPQAYYSDAHLDTLGFCLWLAITRLSSNGDAIIVLDDIFTTLDEKHFDRVMDVLVNEVDNFSQIILTTHHRHELNGDANIIELQSWNIENGIRMKN